VFQQFAQIGSVRQALLWFLEHGLQLPARKPGGGEILWKRPSYHTIYAILTNPIYAGAYAYGKTERTIRYEDGQPREYDRHKPRSEWSVLIPESHEGYVGWQEFERLQGAIHANFRLSGQPGAVRNGPALLAGLVRCHRCASKLTVHYTGAGHNVLRYSCYRAWLDKGQPRCITLAGTPVDAAVSREIIRAVQPAAIEGWLTLTEAARLIGVSPKTLRLGVEHGELKAEHPLAEGPGYSIAISWTLLLWLSWSRALVHVTTIRRD